MSGSTSDLYKILLKSPALCVSCWRRTIYFDALYIKSFEILKQRLIKTPIINSLDWSKPFKVMFDASSVVLGAMLGQRDGKLFHPIFYTSKI